jgi:hypothetical protein
MTWSTGLGDGAGEVGEPLDVRVDGLPGPLALEGADLGGIADGVGPDGGVGSVTARATGKPAVRARRAAVPSPTKIGFPTDRETTGTAPPSLRH